MTRRHDGADLLQAQRGHLLSDYLRAPAPRRARRAAAQGARPALPGAGERVLDGGERLRILDTLTKVFGGAYCHLPQKRAAYAIDPVQALLLLRGRAVELSDGEFHLAVTSIVTGLRDAHPRYSGPKVMQGAVAALPFLVEQYGTHDDPTFVVSKLSAPELVHDKEFKKGVALTSWNGVPFARAVDMYADRETGGRPDARRARALESLTFRALEYGPPPDELWVSIGYRSSRGASREVRMNWRVVVPGLARSAQPGLGASRFIAADPAAEQVRRAKKLMFSGELWKAEASGAAVARARDWIPTPMHDALAAREVEHRAVGELGYLRIWSFDVPDDDAFIAEVVRLLDLLPGTGLILDLRGNPGGLIWAAERLLQLFTPNRIAPTRFSLLATPLTRAMARSAFNRLELEPWLPSLEAAISTGDAYSQPLPLTDPVWCNDIGQRYGGPVVCVVDPNTYSSGDLFAAGFVDNEIGPLVCVGEATGAGGANVWTHHDVRQALSGTEFELSDLPSDVGYTLAVRRAVRSLAADGVPIEDLGVAGIHYAMTSTDLLRSNEDLVVFCGGLLAGADRTSMKVTVQNAAVTVTTAGLDELEVYVDERAQGTRMISDGAVELARPKAAAMEFVGRRRGEIRQRRKVAL